MRREAMAELPRQVVLVAERWGRSTESVSSPSATTIFPGKQVASDSGAALVFPLGCTGARAAAYKKPGWGTTTEGG